MFFEHGQRIIISPALHILRQPKERRPTIGRVEHRGNGIGQGLDDLRGMRDPIPIAGHGLERIVHAECRITEMFELLQNRIGQTGYERITTQHQHGQAVGMRQRRCCEQIRCPRPGRGRTEHEPLTQPLLGIASGCKSHTLFVLPTVERQRFFMIIQRLAQTGDVAMAKDAKTASAQAPFIAIYFDVLGRQISDNRLSGC